MNTTWIHTSIISSNICLTILVFLFHLFHPSIINEYDQHQYQSNYSLSLDRLAHSEMQTIVDYHDRNPAYARRPLTNWLMKELSQTVGIEMGYSFVIVSFGLLCCCGIVIGYLGLHYGYTQAAILCSIVLFYNNFSILFGWFKCTYTHDEPLQYLLLFACLYTVHQRKIVFFSVLFFLALIARESSILLLPAFLFLLSIRTNKDKVPSLNISLPHWSTAFWIMLSLCCYGLYLYAYLHYLQVWNNEEGAVVEGRFHAYRFNFQNIPFAIESITSIFLGIGMQSFILYVFCKYKQLTALDRSLIYATLISILLNTIVVLWTARAREIRLFALPLIFVWASLGHYTIQVGRLFIQQNWKRYSLDLWYNKRQFVAVVLQILMLTGMNYYFARHQFQPSNFSYSTGIRCYLFVTLSLVTLITFFRYQMKNSQRVIGKEKEE